MLTVLAGCGRPYTPPEPSPEQEELRAELASLKEDFRDAAAAASGEYRQITVLDRDHTFEDNPDWGRFVRVLILHPEHLDLDDYAYSRPSQENADQGQLRAVFGNLFWINSDGQVLFDDYEQPPGTQMVVEWFIQHDVPEASLHFGGNPCLTVRLTE